MGVFKISLDQIAAKLRDGVNGHQPQLVHEAEQMLHAVLNQSPENWNAAFLLAGAFMQTERHGAAINLLENVISKRADVPAVWNNLGTCYRKEHINDKAERAFLMALKYEPNDADVYSNLGTLYINEGNPDQAKDYLEQAISIDPSHPNARWNLSLAQLELEDWEHGFPNYQWGQTSLDRMRKNYIDARGHRVPWWQGQKVGTLVVHDEQGVGDSVMYASMFDELRQFCDTLIIDGHPRLETLYNRAFPWAVVKPTRKIIDEPVPWERDYVIDAKVAVGDVGRWLRKKESDFPKTVYMQPNPELVEQYKAQLRSFGPGPYIAVGHVGGHKKTRKDIRSLSFDTLLPVFKAFPNATFISCDYTNRDEEYAQLKAEHGVDVKIIPEVFEGARFEKYFVTKGGVDLREFTDKSEAKAFRDHVQGDGIRHEYGPGFDLDSIFSYFAAIKELGGIVLSVNSSNVHFCGASGVPCVTFTPSKPAWRYGLDRSDMVWYGPWVKQFRQQGEDWGPAVLASIEHIKDVVKDANG